MAMMTAAIVVQSQQMSQKPVVVMGRVETENIGEKAVATVAYLYGMTAMLLGSIDEDTAAAIAVLEVTVMTTVLTAIHEDLAAAVHKDRATTVHEDSAHPRTSDNSSNLTVVSILDLSWPVYICGQGDQWG